MIFNNIIWGCGGSGGWQPPSPPRTSWGGPAWPVVGPSWARCGPVVGPSWDRMWGLPLHAFRGCSIQRRGVGFGCIPEGVNGSLTS